MCEEVLLHNLTTHMAHNIYAQILPESIFCASNRSWLLAPGWNVGRSLEASESTVPLSGRYRTGVCSRAPTLCPPPSALPHGRAGALA